MMDLFRLVQSAEPLLYYLAEALAPRARQSELLVDRLRFERLVPGQLRALVHATGSGLDPDFVLYSGELLEVLACSSRRSLPSAQQRAKAFAACHASLERPEVVLGALARNQPEVYALVRSALVRPARRRTDLRSQWAGGAVR